MSPARTTPQAVAYNPAGITQLPGTTLMFGSALSLPSGSIETRVNGKTTDTDAKKDYWILPHFYATHQMTDSLCWAWAFSPVSAWATAFPATGRAARA